jgi:hypothetical protein
MIAKEHQDATVGENVQCGHCNRYSATIALYIDHMRHLPFATHCKPNWRKQYARRFGYASPPVAAVMQQSSQDFNLEPKA